MYILNGTRSRCMLCTMAFPGKIDSGSILAAAVDLLEREGEAALTLRRAASALEVTPNALYRYFSSRDVLVAAVANETARRLLCAVDEALGISASSAPADDAARTRILMQTYADFADRHPVLYKTLMMSEEAAAAELAPPLYPDLLWARVVEVLEPLTGQERAPAAAVTLWSLLHGLWALKQANRLGGKKPADIAEFAFEALLRGLRG